MNSTNNKQIVLLISLFFTGAIAKENQINFDYLKKNAKQLMERAKKKSQKVLEASKPQRKKFLKFAKEHKKEIGIAAFALVYGIGYLEARARNGTNSYAIKHGLFFGTRTLLLQPPLLLSHSFFKAIGKTFKEIGKLAESMSKAHARFYTRSLFKLNPFMETVEIDDEYPENYQAYSFYDGDIRPRMGDKWSDYHDFWNKYLFFLGKID